MAAHSLDALLRLKAFRQGQRDRDLSSAQKHESDALRKWESAQVAAAQHKTAGDTIKAALHPGATNLGAATLEAARHGADAAKLKIKAKALQTVHATSQKQTAEALLQSHVARKHFQKTDSFLKSYAALLSQRNEAHAELETKNLCGVHYHRSKLAKDERGVPASAAMACAEPVA